MTIFLAFLLILVFYLYLKPVDNRTLVSHYLKLKRMIILYVEKIKETNYKHNSNQQIANKSFYNHIVTNKDLNDDDFKVDLNNDDDFKVEPNRFWDKNEFISVAARLGIIYTNNNGIKSKRVINISKYDGSSYLKAYCEFREETRTFNIDNISVAVDTETGEIISDVPSYLVNKYEKSPIVKAMNYWSDIGWVSVTARLDFDYINAKGDKSKRVINIYGYGGASSINGYCEAINRFMVFRIDRMAQVIDTETGRQIDNVPDYLLKKYKLSPEYKIARICEKHQDIFKVLLYIFKPDGYLRVEEKNVLYSVIRTITGDNDLSKDEITNFIVKKNQPTLHGFKLAFGRVCKDNSKKAKGLISIARKVFNVKRTNTKVKEAIDYMLKKMKKDNLI